MNATNANKVWDYLMQIAWTLWEMFQRGFLLRLEAGCRKMTQVLWCEEIRTYIRHLETLPFRFDSLNCTTFPATFSSGALLTRRDGNWYTMQR